MRLTKDLLSGLMFCAFGIGAAVVAQDYNLGSLSRMGSGFFPTVLGTGLALLGLAITVRAVIKPETSEPIADLGLRPAFFISVAIVLFGVLIDDFGLLAALAALIIVARFAGREGSVLELAVMVIVLTAIAVAVFVYALGVRLDLVPW